MLKAIGGDTQSEGAHSGNRRFARFAVRHYSWHGLDIGPPASVLFTSDDDWDGRYRDCLRRPLVYSAASLINCSACFSASAVTRSPESIRPISLVRSAGDSSTMVASVRPRSSCFST